MKDYITKEFLDYFGLTHEIASINKVFEVYGDVQEAWLDLTYVYLPICHPNDPFTLFIQQNILLLEYSMIKGTCFEPSTEKRVMP